LSPQPSDDVRRRAHARVVEVGGQIGSQVPELTAELHRALAESITELQGDAGILELLHASIQSNIETIGHVVHLGIAMDEVTTPSAAEEYARRLAQRGISSTALLRAYRLGHQMVLAWGYDRLRATERDLEVAYAAAAEFTEVLFAYIDSISEQVVHEYEAERERWLANRSTVRTAVLTELLDGSNVDVAAAEAGLGYRLRQDHLGVVLWTAGGTAGAGDLRQLERLLADLATAVGATGQPLFFPTDRSTCWGWIPLGQRSADVAPARLAPVVDKADSRLRAAVGTPGAGAAGFRNTHREAERARQVALAAQADARRLTPYADPGVRTAAMLATDLESARRLVSGALGGLAAPTASAARLRETLRVFLEEKGSYVATAERVHLHKNTVKYRVDRAVEERGRPLDEDRLELEVALVASDWLGRAVLPAGPD